jgi:hypothetical protein
MQSGTRSTSTKLSASWLHRPFYQTIEQRVLLVVSMTRLPIPIAIDVIHLQQSTRKLQVFPGQ